MRKKRIVVLIAVLITIFLSIFEVSAVNAEPCGENAFFVVENGVLTIRGKGGTYDFLNTDGVYDRHDIPWSTRETDDESERIYKVVVEEGITYLGINAFHDMAYMTEVSLPSSLQAIGSGCFYGCSSLKSIEIPSSVTRLGESNSEEYNRYGMFEYCKSIEKIVIPVDSQLRIIEAGAFYKSGASGLEIYIPEKVENIGRGCFGGYFKSIDVSENNKFFCSKDGVLYSKDMTTLVSFPSMKKGGVYKIPNTVTEIKELALANFGVVDYYTKSGSAKLYIPDSVKTMDERALVTEAPIEVFFSGSENEWEQYVDARSISILSDNKIHFNYQDKNIARYIAPITGGVLVVFTSAFLIKKKKLSNVISR